MIFNQHRGKPMDDAVETVSEIIATCIGAFDDVEDVETRILAAIQADPLAYLGRNQLTGSVERAAACVNALAGIADPEAFMRDVECLVFSDEGDDAGFQAWLRLQKIFMKGTDQ